MMTIRKLVLAMAAAVAVSGGNAWAEGENEHSGPNVMPGSVSVGSAQDVMALVRELEQSLRQPESDEADAQPEPTGRGAPPSSTTPDAGPAVDASHRGPNIAGDAPVFPDRPEAGRQGGRAGSPGVARQCLRCVNI